MPPVYRLSYSDSLETQSMRKDVNNSLDREKIRAVIITGTTEWCWKATFKLQAKLNYCQATLTLQANSSLH